VYWLTCLKRKGVYALRCERLFDRVVLPRAQRQAALAQVMQVYAQRLEAACRAVPYAWFNFYPFWSAQAARRS
jgi:predicted LPLAT superfamily acyltransferase